MKRVSCCLFSTKSDYCRYHEYSFSDYGEICWIYGKFCLNNEMQSLMSIFCYLQKFVFFATAGKSVNFPGRSPAKDCVRGTNYPGGYAVAQNKR